MPTYNLNLKLTAEQLKDLPPGFTIVIAKPTEGNSPNVAWQVFRPFENNSVAWEEQYGIYVSTASIKNGALLTPMSRTDYPALQDKRYKLEDDGAFGPPEEEPGGDRGNYYAQNDYSGAPLLTFGLFQDAIVNATPVSGNPVSAEPVPYRNGAAFLPLTTVYIWLQSNVVSRTVETQVTSWMTKVVFREGEFEAPLAYDSESGTFIPLKEAGVSVTALERAIF